MRGIHFVPHVLQERHLDKLVDELECLCSRGNRSIQLQVIVELPALRCEEPLRSL